MTNQVEYSAMLSSLEEVTSMESPSNDVGSINNSTFCEIDLVENNRVIKSSDISMGQATVISESYTTDGPTYKVHGLNQQNVIPISLYQSKDPILISNSQVELQTRELHSAIERLNLEKSLNDKNKLDLNTFVNKTIEKLQPSAIRSTAVEQPHTGRCLCFICGYHLLDFDEKFSYFKSQKLFQMQMPLLQLLSEIVNQTVLTNSDPIELCSQCSEIVNELDIALKHLNDLKSKVIALFSNNKRPKMTFHILPTSAQTKNVITNLKAKQPKENELKIKKINLDDLAQSRPKRGRSAKKYGSIGNKIVDPEPIKKHKSKGGRPRKPFQCNICKRKFLSQGILQSHVKKEHRHITFSSVLREKLTTDIKPNPLISKKEESIIFTKLIKEKVKTENEKSNNENKINKLEDTETSPEIVVSSNGFADAGIRPIQPKPQTLVQANEDGSMLCLMKPAVKESSPTLIQVSAGYFNLKSDKYSCGLCNKSFSYYKSFRSHRLEVHNIKKSKDREDTNTAIPSSQNGELKRDKWPFSCTICKEVFEFKYEYETHKETHIPFNQVGPQVFICNLCDHKVASKSALKIHLQRIHDKKQTSKDFLCAKCGYMTNTKRAFSEHLRVHSDSPSQKTQCKICNKRLLTSSYRIHMVRMHGEEAKYPCKSCDQKFRIRSDLTKHMNVFHSSFSSLNCNDCFESFVTTEELRYHKMKQHSRESYCECCGSTNKSEIEFQNHTIKTCQGSIAKYGSTSCSSVFTDQKRLKQHVLKHDSGSQCKMVVFNASTNFKHVKEKPEEELLPSEFQTDQNTSESNVITTTQTLSLSDADRELLEPVRATNLTEIQSFQHSEQDSISLTTLQSHIPTDRCYSSSHLQDHAHYSAAHSSSSTNVQSIYLVSDIQMGNLQEHNIAVNES